MKDNFSNQSNLYAIYRPTYPPELYSFLYNELNDFSNAWDCATGNGQMAVALSAKFKNVYATDISEKQINNATKKENIIYKIEAAEKTHFANDFFDLITEAQALHWFNFELFYKEVKRVIKNDGLFAAITYTLCKTNDATDDVLKYFYEEITMPYWDSERKYIDEKYQTIPFPFEEIKTPEFEMVVEWKREQMIGFLNTWSAVQHYIKKNKNNPVEIIIPHLYETWPEDLTKKVIFPVTLRAAVIKK